MKFIVSSLNLLNQTIGFDKPIDISAANLGEVTKFFKGESANSSAVILKDSQSVNINNYIEFLKNNYNVALSGADLGTYILNASNQADLESIIQTKSIEMPAQAAGVSSGATVESKLATLTSGFTPEQLASFNKIADTMVKIKTLDKEIAAYQNQKTGKEDLDKSLKAKEVQKVALEQKLASVQSLLEHQKKLDIEISKGKSAVIGESDIDAIKIKRIEERSLELSNGFKQAQKNMFNEKEAPVGNKIQYPFLIVFIALQLILSLGYFAVSLNSSYLLIGLVITLILSLLFGAIQLSSKNAKKISEPMAKVNTEVPQIVQTNTSSSAANSTEDRYIISKAYLNALLTEKDNIAQNIQKALDNQTYETVSANLVSIKKEIEQINSSANSPENKVLSVDDYYKKRRELDISKIEKDNLEFSSNLPNKPDEEYINLLLGNSSTQSIDSKLYLPILIISKERKFDEIIEKYNNIRQVIILYETS